MDPTEPRTWHLRDRGRDLRVEVRVSDGRNHARLLVDGDEMAAGDTDAIGDVKLSAGTTHVKAGFWWKGRVAAVDLIERGDDAEQPEKPFSNVRRTMKVPFIPPAGTRAARLHTWREGHPRWWAARHVAIQTVSILVAVLGISALLNAIIARLVPAIDWSWVPSFEVPHWLEYLNPSYWIGRLLPDWDWFGWIPEFDVPDLGWLKYVIILLIAVATGIAELRKRRERERREAVLREEAAGTDPALRSRDGLDEAVPGEA